MDPSELSSTPSSTQQRSILVNAQGSPMKVNLQAVELEGRPRLVRTLKSAGALVVSNAKEAAIILVDSATESGKRLIRTWGHDSSKVVLEHVWARASVNAGRPLLEPDNWGGSMTVDDGKPVTIDGVVVDEDELDEVEALVTKSPLPTPRVTPVDPPSNGPEHTVAEHSAVTRLESNTSGPPPPGPPKARPAVVDTTISEELMTITDDNTKPLQSPPPPLAAQPLACSQPTLFAQPPQPQNTYAYAPYATQQAYPSSQSRMMPTQPFLHPDFPPSQPQLAHDPSVPHISSPSVQSLMTQMASNTTSINGLNLQAAITTIMEVVRHMDHPSWIDQNQLLVPQPPANANTLTFSVQPPATAGPVSEPTFQVTRKVQSPGVDASLSSSQGHLGDIATSSQRRGSVTEVCEDLPMTRRSRAKLARRLFDQAITPSIPRKRPPIAKATNPPKRLRKGKEKAISTDSSEHSEVDERTEASDGSGPYSTRSSASPPVRRQNIIERKKHGEIFLSSSGLPLRFFVQVDLHGRHTVVTNIKKNKGKIVNNIADADYLILFARSDTFQGLLNEATALGKFPVLAAFVADCIEEGVLLDETDYILESATKVKSLKRGHRNTSFLKVETPESLPRQAKVVKRKSSPTPEKNRKSKRTPLKPSTDTKLKKEPKSVPARPTTAEKGEDITASRFPTPPPPTTRQLLKNGKYLFTTVEDEYFLRLAEHYLTRDPTISNTALVHKLHEQLPHHTLASWTAHIDKKIKGAVGDIRKRANIAKRKRDEAANRNSSQGLTNEAESSEGHTAEGSSHTLLNPSSPFQEDPGRQDFDVITRFFASGGGDDDDDERVWQELEKHQPCRSASSWPEYYAAHEKQVYARIEELMNERAGD